MFELNLHIIKTNILMKFQHEDRMQNVACRVLTRQLLKTPQTNVGQNGITIAHLALRVQVSKKINVNQSGELFIGHFGISECSILT